MPRQISRGKRRIVRFLRFLRSACCLGSNQEKDDEEPIIQENASHPSGALLTKTEKQLPLGPQIIVKPQITFIQKTEKQLPLRNQITVKPQLTFKKVNTTKVQLCKKIITASFWTNWNRQVALYDRIRKHIRAPHRRGRVFTMTELTCQKMAMVRPEHHEIIQAPSIQPVKRMSLTASRARQNTPMSLPGVTIVVQAPLQPRQISVTVTNSRRQNPPLMNLPGLSIMRAPRQQCHSVSVIVSRCRQNISVGLLGVLIMRAPDQQHHNVLVTDSRHHQNISMGFSRILTIQAPNQQCQRGGSVTDSSHTMICRPNSPISLPGILEEEIKQDKPKTAWVRRRVGEEALFPGLRRQPPALDLEASVALLKIHRETRQRPLLLRHCDEQDGYFRFKSGVVPASNARPADRKVVVPMRSKHGKCRPTTAAQYDERTAATTWDQLYFKLLPRKRLPHISLDCLRNR